MKTCFWLIRSAAHAWQDKALVGRAPGVRLNAMGTGQARTITRALGFAPIEAIYSSPLERARETAQPMAASRKMEFEIEDGLNEIDYGEWTGATFDELAEDPQWDVWKGVRSWSTTPGGETLEEAQERIVDTLDRLRQRHAGEHVVIISHGDVLRAALSWHLSGGLEQLNRIRFGPGAVALLEIWPGAAHLLALQENSALNPELLLLASRRAARARHAFGRTIEVGVR